MKVGKKILSYDESQCYEDEVKYRLENWEYFDYDEKPDEEDVREKLCDCIDFNCYWDDFKECLSEIIKKKNPDGHWSVDVENFGWRNMSGHAFIFMEKGEDITKILPDTQCTFFLYNYGKGIAVQNYHHDSPMGNEWYYLKKATQKEIENETFK